MRKTVGLPIETAWKPQSCGKRVPDGRISMIWTLFVVLIALWLLGLVTSYTLGGFIHILVAVAFVMVLIHLIQGRRGIA